MLLTVSIGVSFSEFQVQLLRSVSRDLCRVFPFRFLSASQFSRSQGSGTFAKSGGVKEHTAPATRVLALLMPDLCNTEIFQVIVGEIAGLARVHNYGLIWGGSGEPELDADSGPHSTRKNCATNSSSAG